MSRHHRRRRQLVTYDEHPRKRLLECGAQSLSDAELVEILLRNGNRGSKAWDLARELMREYGGLIGLVNVDPAYLRRHDVSEPKAAIVVAAFEIACRVTRARMPLRDLLDQPAAVASYLSRRYGHSDQETMGALFMNVRNRLIGESDIFRGTQDRTAVDPRAILKEAHLAIVTPTSGGPLSDYFSLILLSTAGCHRLPSVDQLAAELRAAGFELVRRERLVPGDAVWGIVARNTPVAGNSPAQLL